MSDTAPSYREARPKLVAGNLSLDFVNTVEWRGNPARFMERLTNYDELLIWAEAAGVLDKQQAERCRTAAATRPTEAAGVLQRTIALRENLADVLSRQQKFSSLSDINFLLRQIPRDGVLRGRQGRYVWHYAGGERLTDVLWPLLWSAAAFLTGGDLARLSRCANEDCGWFFLDHSRNRSRRWCSMESCGNRAKARRHYARQKSVSTRPPAD